MKKLWPLRVAYAFALLLQVALLAGAYELFVLSETRMMVMRYLVAQNASLETSWFAPWAVMVQAGALFALAVLSMAYALRMRRRGARFLFAQATILAALATTGAWLASSVSAADVTALYAILLAVWCALLVQLVVTAVSVRRAGRDT